MLAAHSADEYDQYKIRNAAQRKRKQQVVKKQFTPEEFSALQQMAKNVLEPLSSDQCLPVSKRTTAAESHGGNLRAVSERAVGDGTDRATRSVP